MTPTASSPPSASPARLTLFYVALYLLALAQGFYGPCAEAFGADQFTPSVDTCEPSGKVFFAP